MLEADKQPPEILAVLVNAVILGFDVLLLQKTDHRLLQLTTALARDDLYQRDTVLNGLIDHAVQLGIDLLPLVEDLMKVEHQFRHGPKIAGADKWCDQLISGHG